LFLSAWTKTYLSWIVYRVSATSGYFNARLSRHYGDWSIIDNENIHKILAKGGKYRDPLSINWRLIPFQKLLGRCFETGKLGGSMITKATSALKYPEVAETLYTLIISDSSFDSVVAVYVGLPCELCRPNFIFNQSM
jgi:hypothetical protein